MLQPLFNTTMKPIATLISTLMLIILFSSCSKDKKLKSVYGFQNDTIVSIKNYDREERLIFDRTTQIIENWDGKLLTWITAIEFEGSKPLYQYYAHSSAGLSITLYDYDDNGELINEYSKFYNTPNKGGGNPFAAIYEIESIEALKTYLLRAIPDSIPFSNNLGFRRESDEFYKSSKDSNGHLVKEYWTIEDGIETSRMTKRYDASGKLIFKYDKTRWIEEINKFQYNSNGELIEELKIWNPDKNRFQRKEYFYSNELLQKTLYYHDTALAFTYEYFYKDTLLQKEIKTRITETERFKDRRKIETIEYRYEYFE